MSGMVGADMVKRAADARRRGNLDVFRRLTKEAHCLQRALRKKTMMRQLAAQHAGHGTTALKQWRKQRQRSTAQQLMQRCK